MKDRIWIDWRGTPINMGDRIIWAAGKHSSIELREGIVEDLVEKTINRPGKIKVRVVRSSRSSSTGNLVTIERFDRVTVL